MKLLAKYNYNKQVSNFNCSNNNCLNSCKEFVYENNIFNKLFLLISNNIFAQFPEIHKQEHNQLCLFIPEILSSLLPKLYKYYKNIIIINNNANNNNINFIIGNTKENNSNNKKHYLEKIYDEIFTKIISVIISNQTFGDFIKRKYILLIPNFILYSRNRKTYLEYMRKEVLASSNYFYRKYSIIFIEKCFEMFSFEFIHKMHLYEDILNLMKDKINIISTGIIEIIYNNNKKIISYSSDIFQEICDSLKIIYEANIKAFNTDIKNFDKDKNILINHIFNIKDSNNTSSKNKTSLTFYAAEELNSIKDNENKLSSFEHDILNYEIISEKNKNQRTGENQDNVNLFHLVNSTNSSFQAAKNMLYGTLSGEYKNINQINGNYLTSKQRSSVKTYTMTDKATSNIVKNLTSKNMGNKHYLPKIKMQKIRKDSNSSMMINNNKNNNIYTIKSTEIINNNKNVNKEKEKQNFKNKAKIAITSQNRSPSAKTYQENTPVTYETPNDINENINSMYYISKSNKNVSLSLRPFLKQKTLSLHKDYNNTYLQRNMPSKIIINADKSNTFFK